MPSRSVFGPPIKTFAAALLVSAFGIAAIAEHRDAKIGSELSIAEHLRDGAECNIPIRELIAFGKALFSAKFTAEDGAGRPMSKGTGAPLSDPLSPLIFPANFDRLSGPDSNSCAGCHNTPSIGGGGDRATEVFVMGQRFDRLTFDHANGMVAGGAVDESGNFVTMNTAFDERKAIGMNGSGFIEMLARQMTADLQATRDATRPGMRRALMTSGVLMVPAYTDLKMHDISATSDPASDPECEPLDQNQPAGSEAFFKGNCKFITRKLWGFYNQGGSFMHHGKFTTAREAVEAHNGEALSERRAFDAIPRGRQDDLIEFLKSLQVLPAGSRSTVMEETRD